MVFNYLTAKAEYDLAIGKVPYVDASNTKMIFNRKNRRTQMIKM